MSMVTFLRRLFIRDYQNVGDENVRSAHGVLAAVQGFIINLTLVAIKLTLAFILASRTSWIFPMALLGDAVDSAGDMLSNMVTLIGFKGASKAPDKDHPYGHQRMEYVAGLIVALLVLFAAFELVKSSIETIMSGASASYSWATVIALGVCALLKLLQGFINLGLAKAIDSPSLKATAIDSFVDIAATGAVIVSAVLSLLFNWNFLDGYFGIAVALFITYTGIMMVKETSDPLIGTPFTKEEEEHIRALAQSEKRILGVHDVRLHRYGPSKTFISLHAEVSLDLSATEIHEMIHAVEEKIAEAYRAEVTIHVDPIDEKDEELSRVKKQVEEILVSLDPHLSLHDFQREGNGYDFDVLVPFEVKIETALIEAKIKEAFGDTPMHIRFDRPYTE